MALVPITGVIYLGLSTWRESRRQGSGALGTGGGANVNIDGVNAWFNPRSNRWETPQPWNEDYRIHTSGGNKLKSVDRKLVHEVNIK